MEDALADDLDLITITQLRQVANQSPQPYRLHVQVESRLEKTTSTGSPFFEIKLVDAADSLLWRVFDNNPQFHELSKLGRNAFIQIAGQWVDGKYGLEPRQVQFRALSEDEAGTLLLGDPDLAARQQADYADIVAFVGSIRDPRLLKLCSVFLERHGERFRRTGAARRNHHARRGGLVEHVAQMMRCAVAVAGVYPNLNRDLMIAGVLFHDCGKLWENVYAESGFTMPYNLTAEMLGHIPLGLELVNKLWRDVMDAADAAQWTTLEPASETVRLHLLHLIAAHHGTHEFGSPVLPKTPEAVALHHVDNIDAKLEMFRRAYETGKELGAGIIEKFVPWPVNIVAPLPAVNLPARTD
ncbi:MAG: HD domain-containing protein [Prosthecobacter sp.]|jgi:3'-5' exoribonuclease|uniref:HD domain-containing protein n=1 Tax=Prosthecobacter sp. TaxID=1965333 RepID=UPI0019F56E5F|nr:HD domain-containing protein [Prosthecobacter sp.]MBE2282576.1 HD domain-containing protein [Prosthecobacter sp.]